LWRRSGCPRGTACLLSSRSSNDGNRTALGIWARDLSLINTPRLRAPEEDGAVLSLPPLNEAGLLLAFNRQRVSVPTLGLLGRSFAELREGARKSAIRCAEEYLHGAGERPPHFASSGPILMAGHQPELFHPGVWVKNFALNGLARAHDAVPLNLIVD